MKLGTLTPSFRLGGNTPSRIYRGSNLVFLNPLSLSPALWLSDTGSNLAQWEDLSGNGRHAVQATPANRPSIVSGALNGRQVRRFNGSSQFLSLSDRAILKNLPGATLFAVVKSVVQTPGERAIFSYMTSTTASLFYAAQSGSQLSYGGRRVAGTSGDFSFFGTFEANAPKIIATQQRWSVGQKEAWMSAGQNDTDLAFQTAGNSENANSAFDPTIGKIADAASQFFNGDIAEILVFPTALSTADRQAVENYLNAKWAIY